LAKKKGGVKNTKIFNGENEKGDKLFNTFF